MLTRKGFAPLVTVESAEELLAGAGRPGVRVILLDLALAGLAGLGIIPPLLAVAPNAAIVVLSPFAGLRAAALQGGAYDLVDPQDLRDLDRCLDRLVAEAANADDQRPEMSGSPEPPVATLSAPGPQLSGSRRTKAFPASPAL